MRLIIIGVVVLALVAAGLAFVLLPEQEIEAGSSANHQFTIDVPMERVRKILVRTNAAKKIIAMSDAELKGQKWVDMDFEMPGKILDRNWHVDGQGKLEVLIKDSYLGDNRITLNQSVDITRQRLHVINRLDQPTDSIRNYDSVMTLTPNDVGNAQFECQLDLEIKTTANGLIKSRVESEIKSAAAKSLERQEQAIRAVVDEQADKILILPGATE